MLLSGGRLSLSAVKLVKRQINGDDHVVLKQNASLEDLRAEASRLHLTLGYQLQADDRGRRYTATHPFYRGRYVLSLEAE